MASYSRSCDEQDTKTHKVAVENLTDTKGYATSDAWEPHPTKPGFWRMLVIQCFFPFLSSTDTCGLFFSVGRLDDVLILASGENMVPGPMENIIMSSPLVFGAVIFGRGRNQVGLLLEPRPGVIVGDLGEFRNKIWFVSFYFI